MRRGKNGIIVATMATVEWEPQGRRLNDRPRLIDSVAEDSENLQGVENWIERL